MSDVHAVSSGRSTFRAAALLAGLYLALAVGVPWLLHDAPPSPEVAFVARLCCAPVAGSPATAPVHSLAPGR